MVIRRRNAWLPLNNLDGSIWAVMIATGAPELQWMKTQSIVQGLQESTDGIKATRMIDTVISVVAVVVQGDAMTVALLQVASYIVSENQPVHTQSTLHWIAATKTGISMLLEHGDDMIFIPAEAARRQIGMRHEA